MSENLFSNFDTVNKQEWLSKIVKDAKGKSIEDFEWKINSHLTQSPFVRKDDLSGSYNSISRGSQANSWYVVEPIVINQPYESNQEIIKSLEQGASGIQVLIDKSLSEEEFSKLFKGVNFTYIYSMFELGANADVDNTIENLLSFCEKNKQSTKDIRGGLRIDNQTLFHGNNLSRKYNSSLPEFSFSYVKSDELFGYKETVIHEISSLISGLRSLLEEGIDQGMLNLEISLSKSYLLNIAKIRAIHIIVANLSKLYQQSFSYRLGARLSAQSLSGNENQKLIEFTSQAMSAVVGGVDSLCLPATDSDEIYNGSLNRKRLSRNIQSLMQMESFMNKVADPAAGSYYIESLTDKIADQSWEYLQNHS